MELSETYRMSKGYLPPALQRSAMCSERICRICGTENYLNFTKTLRTPIETQIVVLKTEMENLQSEIKQLNNSGTSIQQKIDKVQAEISADAGRPTNCYRED